MVGKALSLQDLGPYERAAERAKLSEAELGWAVEWARELEYQYGPAPRARRLALAVADLLADWSDGA